MNRLLNVLYQIARWALIAGGVLFWIFVIGWVGRQRHSVTLRGHVEDAITGKRVPDAKVVISVRSVLFMQDRMRKYGTTTNAKGNFQITARPGFRIDWMDVGACAPDGKVWVREELSVPPNYAPIDVYPMAHWMRRQGSYTYRDFDGGWGGDTIWLRNEESETSAAD